MTTAKKIAALLVALDGGYELKVESGHRIAMSENGHPGFVMMNGKGEQLEELYDVGGETVYMMIVGHAQKINEDDIELIEESFR